MWQGSICSFNVTLFKTVNQVSFSSLRFSAVVSTRKSSVAFWFFHHLQSPVNDIWRMERVSALLSPQYLDSYSYIQTNSERLNLNQAWVLVVFLVRNQLPGLPVCKSHRNINNISPLNHRYSTPIYPSSCKHIFCFNRKQIHPTHLSSTITVLQTHL